MNVPLNRVKMGVIVQEMVDADVSGVMFTANIVTNDPCQIIIESTWGLGEPLVSGKVIPDTYVLDKNPLRVLQRTLGTKAVVASIAARNQQQGVVLQETPPDKQSTLSLNDVNLLKVAQMGMSVEKILGGPQDIEWCIRDSQLIVLQARPVTTMQQSSYRDKG
jgi:pyruvate,water dikinase